MVWSSTLYTSYSVLALSPPMADSGVPLTSW